MAGNIHYKSNILQGYLKVSQWINQCKIHPILSVFLLIFNA